MSPLLHQVVVFFFVVVFGVVSVVSAGDSNHVVVAAAKSEQALRDLQSNGDTPTPLLTPVPVEGTVENLEMTLRGLNQLLKPPASTDWKVITEEFTKAYYTMNLGLGITNLETTIAVSSVMQGLAEPDNPWSDVGVKIQYTQDIRYHSLHPTRDTPEALVQVPFVTSYDRELYLDKLQQSNSEFDPVDRVSRIHLLASSTATNAVGPLTWPHDSENPDDGGSQTVVIVAVIVAVGLVLSVGTFVYHLGRRRSSRDHHHLPQITKQKLDAPSPSKSVDEAEESTLRQQQQPDLEENTAMLHEGGEAQRTTMEQPERALEPPPAQQQQQQQASDSSPILQIPDTRTAVSVSHLEREGGINDAQSVSRDAEEADHDRIPSDDDDRFNDDSNPRVRDDNDNNKNTNQQEGTMAHAVPLVADEQQQNCKDDDNDCNNQSLVPR